MTSLAERHCRPVIRTTPPLGQAQIEAYLEELPGWVLEHATISRTFPFSDFHDTMAFVNAVAWVSHREDHHPDMHVSYDRCRVQYSTHSIGGLSENDFICAAKIEALLR
jgi:4a-hydroxytetrahydrobiopterin dehydratase